MHKGEEKYLIKQHEERIQKKFFNITNDLKIITESYPECFNEENQEQTLKNFTTVLRLFSQHRQVYDQIRLINKDGMEQIRINLVAGQPVIVPKNDLQHKGTRYYFKETIQLSSDEIFISPFDLNMEHGSIEKPYKPVIRFGAPVFDQNKEKQGVVILNYLGQEILDQFSEHATAGLHGKVMLLNHQGYWLFGEQQDDAWAFMWPDRTDQTFQRRYPEAWKTIATKQSGQFERNNNIFTFETLFPLHRNITSSSNTSASSGVFQKKGKKITADPYYWKLLTRLSLEEIKQEHLIPVRYNLALFNAVFFALLLPSGWFLISFYVSREAARQDLNHFKNVLDRTVDCVFMFDPETLRFTYVNQGAKKQVGYSSKEFSTMTPLSIKPDFTETAFQEIVQQITTGSKNSLFFQTVHQHKNGTRIPVEIHLQYIQPQRSAACFVAIVRDITHRKQAEKNLAAAHQRLLTILDSIDAMVYVIDIDSYEILFLNQYASEIFGNKIGSTCWKNLQKDLKEPCNFCAISLLRNNEKYAKKSYVWERKNPFNDRWYALHDRLIKWLDGREVKIQISTDITERKIIEQQLHYNAYHDSLTGIANRLLFYERLKQELDKAKKSSSKLALIFIDLNKFKPINDQYGHDIGDLLLQEVARRLLSSVSEKELVARIGGDEFVLLLPEIQETNDVEQVLDKINFALEAPCQLSLTLELTISAALGTALYPDDGTSENELLNTADGRMYTNKRQNSLKFHRE